MKKTLHVATLAVALICSSALHAQVLVKDPWVRGTVARQTATGAFMSLTAQTDTRLVSATSPVAGVVEIHEMAMEGNLMKMRRVGMLTLPAGKSVDLKPGGYHVMLMDLKRTLAAGESVPLTLTFEQAGGQRSTLEVKATVRALAGGDGGHSGHGGHAPHAGPSGHAGHGAHGKASQ